MKQGYVQVYRGDGKGKTTAAVGLAMRAAAAGLRVYFCQFMKYGPTGELDAFRLFGDRIVAEQFGTGGELSAPDPVSYTHLVSSESSMPQPMSTEVLRR